jgi:hypothetical protein
VPLTGRQQRVYRPLVEAAWAACCRAGAPTEAAAARLRADRIAKDKWYRAQLHACLGIWTTKQIRGLPAFRRLMAHFEALVGESFYWQQQLATGDERQIRESVRLFLQSSADDLRAMIGKDGTVPTDEAVTEYIEVTAWNMFSQGIRGLGHRRCDDIEGAESRLPLAALKPGELLRLKMALDTALRRWRKNHPSHPSHRSHPRTTSIASEIATYA